MGLSLKLKKLNDQKATRKLVLLFLILVLGPGIVLSVLALRASIREEAYLEKQLETTFLAELAHVSELIVGDLEHLQAELDSTFSQAGKIDPFNLQEIKSSSSLVKVPFLFLRKGKFLFPDEQETKQNTPENAFLKTNTDLFQDRKMVEVYQNVAVKYAEKILADDADIEMKPSAAPAPSTESFGAPQAPSQMLSNSAASRRQAIGKFEESREIQEEIYNQIADEKSKLASRVVKSRPKDKTRTVTKKELVQSMYITESLRFSQIIAQSQSGFIPRVMDDQFILLYWRKLGDDKIAGCEIDVNKLTQRIVSLLPPVYNSSRVLTVLNERGSPIQDPSLNRTYDWKLPFVSREISELLPRWEVAAYISSPELIAQRAHLTKLVIAMLVMIFFASIISGSILIYRSLKSELQLAQQRTTFVANVSHELKTPLTSIRLFAEILREGRQTDPVKRRKYLDIMVSETERLTRLINNVLDFSRSRKGKRTYDKSTVDLATLISELVENQRVRLEHGGFAIETMIPEDPVYVEADPEAVKQVFLNILSNAEKYSSDQKWIQVSVKSENGQAVLSVEDRGIGIKPKDAQKIFEEFYRADDSLTSKVRGTGLGLTIARQIMRDHGGDIVFTPAKPVGSRFEVKLPFKEIQNGN